MCDILIFQCQLCLSNCQICQLDVISIKIIIYCEVISYNSGIIAHVLCIGFCNQERYYRMELVGHVLNTAVYITCTGTNVCIPAIWEDLSMKI